MLDNPAKSRTRPAYNDVSMPYRFRLQNSSQKDGSLGYTSLSANRLGWGSLKGLRWWVCLDKMRRVKQGSDSLP